MNASIRTTLLAAALLLAASCARTPRTFPGRPLAPRVPDAPVSSALGDPRPFRFDIVVEIAVDEVLEGAALRAENERLGIPADTPPTLAVWSSNMRDRFGQRGVRLAAIDEKPTRRVFEPENNNEILFWDLGGRLEPGATFTLSRTYEGTLNEYHPAFDAATVPAVYDTLDPVWLFYTKSEPFVELTPEIRRASAEARGDAAHPMDRARSIFQWVRGHMTYVYPPPARGCLSALETGRGDCGQYADLFVALCRADGIPARFVGGLVIVESGAVGSHAWAEIMMPDGSWWPMDATHEPELGFAKLMTNKAMAMSAGRNIPLPGVPGWARYDIGEVEGGRTDFMQTYTMLATGVEISTNVERRFETLAAD